MSTTHHPVVICRGWTLQLQGSLVLVCRVIDTERNLNIPNLSPLISVHFYHPLTRNDLPRASHLPGALGLGTERFQVYVASMGSG